MYKSKYLIFTLVASYFLGFSIINSVDVSSLKRNPLKNAVTSVRSVSKSTPVKPISKAPLKQESNTSVKLAAGKSLSKKIHIKNKVDKESVGYNKLGRHYPKKFIVKVNGTEVKPHATVAIDPGNFEVEYAYEWWAPWGKIIGAKKAKFVITEGQKDVEIKFGGWHSPSKMLINKARQVGQEQKLPDPKF